MSSSVNTDIPSVDFQLRLKRSQFKTPIELIKKNFKNIQKLVEKHNRSIPKLTKTLSSYTIDNDPDGSKKLKAIKQLISTQESFQKKLALRVKQHNEFISRLKFRIEKLKKLAALEEELKVYHDSNKRRPIHLQNDLMEFYSNEVNLMVIDYLLKTSTENFSPGTTAKNIGYLLSKRLKADKLVDYDVILQGLHIYNEIKYKKNLKLLIEWCSENRKALKLSHDDINESHIARGSPEPNDKSNLEFETYFQQFIELVKTSDLHKALDIASSHLISYLKEDEDSKKKVVSQKDLTSQVSQQNVDEYDDEDDQDTLAEADPKAEANFEKIKSGAALLFWNSIDINDILNGFTGAKPDTNVVSNKLNPFASKTLYKTTNLSKAYYDQNRPVLSKIGKNIKPYMELLDENKWTELADFFLYNFNLLYGIDQQLQFLVLLTTGITSLKTKSCSNHNHNITEMKNTDVNLEDNVTFDDFLNLTENPVGFTNCPICSAELFELSSKFPFSHQVKSNIYDNPVMLPNGNLYQLDKLIKFNENYQLASTGIPNGMNSASRPSTALSSVNKESERNGSFSYSNSDNSLSSAKTSLFTNDLSDLSFDTDDDEDDDSEGEDFDPLIVSGNLGSLLRNALPVYGDGSSGNSARKKSTATLDAEELLKSLNDYKIRDPISGDMFKKDELVKVFPT